MRSIFANLRQLVVPAGATGTSPRVVIGPDVPANLQAYYTGISQPVVAAVIMYGNNGTDYYYLADLNLFGTVVTVTGLSIGGVVREISAAYRPNSVGDPNEMDFGALYATTVNFGNPTRATAANDYVQVSQSTDFRIDGASQGRGLIGRIDSTASSAAAGAEAIVLSSPVSTFRNGRCYRVMWAGRTNPSVANTCSYRVRQTNIAGTSLGFWQEVFTSAVGRSLSGCFYVKRTAGTDLSDLLVLTLAASGGTNTMAAAADTVRYLEIYDCGAAADFTNAITIT